MSGHVGDLSPNQEESLAKLRQSLADVLQPQHDDYLLLQFLRARRFDLQKTEDMFRRHIEFRKEFPEDFMVNEYKPPELLIKYLLPPLIGYDKDGCPVRIIQIGKQDIKGLCCCFRRPEIRRCVTWFLDTDKAEMRKRSQETGVYVETRTFIFDLEGLSFRQIYHRDVYELAISFIKLYEYNYPENLKVAYIINTPSFFSFLFNMIKSLITEDTVRKLRIYGYSGWKQDLLETIDADILPACYGGKRTDPDGDPRCPSIVKVFSSIPKEYYLKNQNRLNQDDENVHKVTVGRRSKYSVPIKVDVPSSTITWEVECKNNDVRIYVVYRDGVSTVTVVDPTSVSSDFGVEKGCHLAEKAGEYLLVFDNSYSLLKSKLVLYKVYVSTCTANVCTTPSSNDNGYLRSS